jgi:predicted ATPase
MFIKAVEIFNRNFPKKDRYPFNLKVFGGTDRLNLNADIVFFVGENGTGKSTLLEAIARNYGLTVWGGEKTHIIHRNPYETRLHNFIALKTAQPRGIIPKGFLFRAENFFNYASGIDDMTMNDPDLLKYYGGLSLHQQSHGQAFLSFFENRCKINGLYLLDEPEAALSPPNQLAFLMTLGKIVRKGMGQFVISTHSPIILGCPDSQILSFDYVPIKQIAYEETNSYRFYKRFMNDKESYLKAFGEKTSSKE